MLLSSSNRKYLPYALVSYFSVFVCLRCLLHQILSLIAYTFRENQDFVFIISVQFMMNANSRIRFGLQIIFVCLYIRPSHCHHCANLSEDTELIKCLSNIFCRMCKINSLRPSDAYMRQENSASLVQIMACRLVGAKPLSEPIIKYC